MIDLIDLKESNKEEVLKEIRKRDEGKKEENLESVKNILDYVREYKDKALKELTKKFDGVSIDDFKVSDEEIDEAYKLVDKNFIANIKEAKENILEYHSLQKEKDYILNRKNGVYMGQRVIPLERIGVYVPGGTASYPSTVLMNVIPAKVAGVKEIVMITPPKKDFKIDPYIAVTAKICGVSEIYKVGGAQGVGALAYGTESIQSVDKIVGPGNIFVALAKKEVFGDVDIDMIAGPSEILIIADKESNPKFIAADLMSQAEHDKLASSILLTTSKELGIEVIIELENQMKDLERKDIISQSLNNYGKIIVCKNIDECFEIANFLAPEHLEIMLNNPMNYLGKVKNAGSVFLGEYSPEPVGDYFGGTNHVLPTSGTAKFFSPLSVQSFIKKSSFLCYTREALFEDGEKIINIANKEGLTAHANSIRVRILENEQ
ncbi:MAG: histidinol dehydrogenase [Clostridium baratii]|uniref:histidinol dehydrogenase n=1 Tax=Clostridium baratii TaxID=1561 RepID=UPI0006C2E0C8|nr:histidinol dehydrogenase [Clostridium baratii]MBS6005608.1 histidinol dehydrogenase [Clostridium baratii]MDU4910170.1 histidinol dehydrogenase [Clostridium baratii]CUP29039.1 histidinol dehydrogenase [Clostridium baratii]